MDTTRKYLPSINALECSKGMVESLYLFIDVG